MVSRITREDFAVIVKGLKAAYPKESFLDSEYTVSLWYTALQDIDYPTLNRAATSYIMSKRFAPSVAELRQLAHDLTAPPDDIAAEEWERLLKALGHAGSPEAADYWQQLPETTKEIVGGFFVFVEWANTPTIDLMNVQRPMFIKRFEELTKRKRAAGAIPEPVRTPTKALEEHAPPAIESRGSGTGSGERVEAPKDLIEKLKRRLQK